MNFTDVAVGSIWTAAAINVLGFIWHSYSETYSGFPNAAGGNAGHNPDIPVIVSRKRIPKPGPPKPSPAPIPRRVPAPHVKGFPAVTPAPIIPPQPQPVGTGFDHGGFDIPTPWGPIHIPNLPSLPKVKLPGLPPLPELPPIPIP